MCPFGGASPHLTQYVDWAEVYLPTKWHLGPSSCLATTDMGQNGGCALFRGRGEGSPSNTVWFGTRPTSVSRDMVIYLAV